MDENQYIEALNIRDELFADIYQYALENKIPIIDSDALNIIKNFIQLKSVKSVLEIGTAIGYSGLHIVSVHDDVQLTTVELNKDSYKIADENFKKYNVQDRVNNIHGNAKEVEIDGTFDMIFIDASKGNNQLFLEKYKPLLNPGGFIIVDNILLRGLVIEETIQNKNKRKLKEKVDRFNHYVKENYDHTMYFNVGDGLLVITI
ncbi:O-methyltransferase [Phocicoccus pinnipedialis]|uniref:O-methyltransferase/MSMEI_4947 n=1 Tax=Phocicoccus pinnipedialis TaxID=110845 RepID=A0A6V7REH7_9BACL|nr:O-methyltransferase [Jeotgalicoccus pinnipedialis]MBP1939231.1 putative O-methyltransferase YrrM [Jeotgalicoccus pinnipedialis]CAD2076210.1 Putative O-methyltransferase/MSMEI_4947 [Jeotgalicoccus pinnipedialis]